MKPCPPFPYAVSLMEEMPFPGVPPLCRSRNVEGNPVLIEEGNLGLRMQTTIANGFGGRGYSGTSMDATYN